MLNRKKYIHYGRHGPYISTQNSRQQLLLKKLKIDKKLTFEPNNRHYIQFWALAMWTNASLTQGYIVIMYFNPKNAFTLSVECFSASSPFTAQSLCDAVTQNFSRMVSTLCHSTFCSLLSCKVYQKFMQHISSIPTCD